MTWSSSSASTVPSPSHRLQSTPATQQSRSSRGCPMALCDTFACVPSEPKESQRSKCNLRTGVHAKYSFVITSESCRKTASCLLSNEDIDFLTSEHCLTQWAGYSLEERCKLFHRKHINKTIKPAELAKIYKLCGVKKKAIRYTKVTGPESPCKYDRTAAQIEDELCASHQEGRH